MSQDLSTISATTTIITSMLGSGLNFMPAAFNSLGVLIGMLLITTIGGIVFFCIYKIFEVSHKKASEGMGNDITYAGLLRDISSFFSQVLNWCIFITQFVTGLAFQKYIIKLLCQFIDNFETGVSPQIIRYVLFAVITIPLTLLSFKKNLSKLKICTYLSVFSSVSLASVIFLVNIFCPDFIADIDRDSKIEYNFSFGSAIFIFAMGCMSNVVEVYKLLADRSKVNRFKVAFYASLLPVIIYSSVGLAGYRAFGSEIGTSDIISIFLSDKFSIHDFLLQHQTWLYYVLKAQGFLSIFALICSFPIQLSSATKFLIGEAEKRGIDLKKPTEVFVSLMIAVMTVVNLIPGIPLSFIFDLVGNTTSNFISFFFPALICLKVLSKQSLRMKIFLYILMVASILQGIYGSTNAFYKNFFAPELIQDELITSTTTSMLTETTIFED